MIKNILLASWLLASSLACGYAQGETPDMDKEYIISANNILEIAVYQEPDLSVTVRVSTDGTINYPLLGNIMAAGLTVRGLEKNITELLAADYLVNPQVSVFVKEFAKISILGQVKNPGSYEMKDNLTLTQAVAITGGFVETANTSKVKIIRSRSGKKYTMEVNVDHILNKSAPDPEIKADDTIIVDQYGRISIMGQVTQPGVYSLKKGLTIVEAIGLAGGFSTTASPDGTKVIRLKDNGEKDVIRVPVGSIMKGANASKDILLQDGDTIVVPESFF